VAAVLIIVSSQGIPLAGWMLQHRKTARLLINALVKALLGACISNFLIHHTDHVVGID